MSCKPFLTKVSEDFPLSSGFKRVNEGRIHQTLSPLAVFFLLLEFVLKSTKCKILIEETRNAVEYFLNWPI